MRGNIKIENGKPTGDPINTSTINIPKIENIVPKKMLDLFID
jgi:hypothetical protein